jgi:hypothetical protein
MTIHSPFMQDSKLTQMEYPDEGSALRIVEELGDLEIAIS